MLKRVLATATLLLMGIGLVSFAAGAYYTYRYTCDSNGRNCRYVYVNTDTYAYHNSYGYDYCDCLYASRGYTNANYYDYDYDRNHYGYSNSWDRVSTTYVRRTYEPYYTYRVPANTYTYRYAGTYPVGVNYGSSSYQRGYNDGYQSGWVDRSNGNYYGASNPYDTPRTAYNYGVAYY